jgi:hypothetical protein
VTTWRTRVQLCSWPSAALKRELTSTAAQAPQVRPSRARGPSEGGCPREAWDGSKHVGAPGRSPEAPRRRRARDGAALRWRGGRRRLGGQRERHIAHAHHNHACARQPVRRAGRSARAGTPQHAPSVLTAVGDYPNPDPICCINATVSCRGRRHVQAHNQRACRCTQAAAVLACVPSPLRSMMTP